MVTEKVVESDRRIQDAGFRDGLYRVSVATLSD
jgi:hypothetical protein